MSTTTLLPAAPAPSLAVARPRLARLRKVTADPRPWQAIALWTLMLATLIGHDFGPSLTQIAITLPVAVAMQGFCIWLAGSGRFDPRSALITGTSLCLLLRADEAWLYALAASLAVAGKFAIRVGGKHVFNPANFGIVVLLLAGLPAWVSPGQWGSTLWIAFFLGCASIMVLTRAGRTDLALAFLLAYGGLTFGRALYMGDPLAIPLHQLQSGALLLFTFFMITDPRATPDSRAGRMVFAGLIAALGFWLQYEWQVREGLFYALFAVSPLTPLLDRLLPGARFQWPGQGRAR